MMSLIGSALVTLLVWALIGATAFLFLLWVAETVSLVYAVLRAFLSGGWL